MDKYEKWKYLTDPDTGAVLRVGKDNLISPAPWVPESQVPTTGGLKYDSDKPRLDLLDREFLEGMGKALGFGAAKYAPNNWRKGIALSRLNRAAKGHIIAFNDGEDLDPESGLNHLFHAGCCLMFAAWMLKHRPDLDDRYKSPAPPETE